MTDIRREAVEEAENALQTSETTATWPLTLEEVFDKGYAAAKADPFVARMYHSQFAREVWTAKAALQRLIDYAGYAIGSWSAASARMCGTWPRRPCSTSGLWRG